MSTIDENIVALLQEMHTQWEADTGVSQGASNYAFIEAITDNADGSRTVTTDHGNRRVTILADAEVTPFRSRNIVTLQDLRVGDAVVLYYDVMTLSIPAQASTNRVVLLLAAADETLVN